MRPFQEEWDGSKNGKAVALRGGKTGILQKSMVIIRNNTTEEILSAKVGIRAGGTGNDIRPLPLIEEGAFTFHEITIVTVQHSDGGNRLIEKPAMTTRLFYRQLR